MIDEDQARVAGAKAFEPSFRQLQISRHVDDGERDRRGLGSGRIGRRQQPGA